MNLEFTVNIDFFLLQIKLDQRFCNFLDQNNNDNKKYDSLFEFLL